MATQQKQATLEWAPWYNFAGTQVTCVFCNYSFAYKRKRCMSHFGYPSWTKTSCSKVPTAVKARFLRCGNLIPPRMTEMEINGIAVQGMGSIEPSSSHSIPEGTTSGTHNEENTQSTNRLSHVASSTPRSSRQQSFPEAYQLGKRKELDEMWAKFFYEANIAFNVARHPAFIKAVQATSKAGFDYTPPSYNAMRTTHIEPIKEKVKELVEKKTNVDIAKYGATICSDGWDNVTNRPLMNVMLVCPMGDVFLGSIDTTGSKKCKTYIADTLKTFIEKVGPLNVVQVCTDNATNMLGAMERINEAYPHIYMQGCCAHIMDLLLEDWGREEMFADLVQKAKDVAFYIRNHHVPMALFRRFSPKLSLLWPAVTRFACNYVMIHRLLEVKNALEMVVIDPAWVEYVSSLFNRQNGHRAHSKASQVRATILDESFWHRCANFDFIVAPVLKALRTFDGQTPAMGVAWITMKKLKEHVFNLRKEPFNLPEEIANHLESSFMARWKKMRTDLHYAAALLNPYLASNREIQNDGEAKRALNRVVRKLCGPLGVSFEQVMIEITEYEELRGPYSPLEAGDISNNNLLPHQWWNRVGGDSLPQIAKRILAQTCSASSCERNWSMYSFVHSKSRNRLGVKKAEDLVYIYTNSRLLRERARPNAIHWYDDNVHSEESDPSGLQKSISEDEEEDMMEDGYHWLGGDWDKLPNTNLASNNSPASSSSTNHDGIEVTRNDTMHNVFGDPVDPFVFDDVDVETTPCSMEMSNEKIIEGVSNDHGTLQTQLLSCDNEDMGDPIEDTGEVHKSIHDEGNGVVGNTVDGIGLAQNGDFFNGGDESNIVVNNVEPSMPMASIESLEVVRSRTSIVEEAQGSVQEEVHIEELTPTTRNENSSSIGRTLLNVRSKNPSTCSRPPLHRSLRGPTGGVQRVVLAPQLPSTKGSPRTLYAGSGGESNDPLPFYSGPWQNGVSERVVGAKSSRLRNLDGITHSRRNGRVKRLVNTTSNTGVQLEVRNLNSEIEEYVAPTMENCRENLSSSEEDSYDEDCDEVPGDNSIVLHGISVPQNRRRSNRKRKRDGSEESEN